MSEKTANEILNEYAKQIIEKKGFSVFQTPLQEEIVQQLYKTNHKDSSDVMLKYITELHFAMEQVSSKLKEYEELLDDCDIPYDSMFGDD